MAAEYYNERHGIPIDVVTGDLVFCEDHAFNMSDLPAKILPKCTGPGSTGGLVRTPILSEEAYRGPRSGKPEESLDNLNARREESCS